MFVNFFPRTYAIPHWYILLSLATGLAMVNYYYACFVFGVNAGIFIGQELGRRAERQRKMKARLSEEGDIQNVSLSDSESNVEMLFEVADLPIMGQDWKFEED
jgi:hypothetical protein